MILDNIRSPNYNFAEDFWVNAKVFYKCQRKVTIRDRYYYYFQHKKSITNSLFREETLDSILLGKDIFKFYEKKLKALCPYVALFIITQIIGLYILLKESDSLKKWKINILTCYSMSLKHIIGLSMIRFSKMQDLQRDK